LKRDKGRFVKGYHYSSETEFKKGQKMPKSEEHKRKIGLANKGKLKGRIPWNKGIPHSEETKKKISEIKIKKAKRIPLKQRFWTKVKKTEYCWLWTAGVNTYGYGKIGLGGRKRGSTHAHRVSWMLHNSKIPKGIFVLHKCDNPLCVNPKHLFLGTAKDNIQDAIKKGRFCSKGEKNPMAKLTWKKVSSIRRMYKTGNYLCKDLAKIFHINPTTIYLIVTNKQWKPT